MNKGCWARWVPWPLPGCGSPVREAFPARGQQRVREQESLSGGWAPPTALAWVWRHSHPGAVLGERPLGQKGPESLRRVTQEPRDPGAQRQTTRTLVPVTFGHVPQQCPAWASTGWPPVLLNLGVPWAGTPQDPSPSVWHPHSWFRASLCAPLFSLC